MLRNWWKITKKTLNIDNPKLSCRIEGLSSYSPKRIILDKNLSINKNSYIFKSSKKGNTVIFYNKAKSKLIEQFIKKGIKLIKLNTDKTGLFDLALVLDKIYSLGCRNLLVEGGNDLSSSFVKKKLFNQFYLFKSPNNLSKLLSYKDFNFFKDLSQNYKTKSKINTKLGLDSITLYKK